MFAQARQDAIVNIFRSRRRSGPLARENVRLYGPETNPWLAKEHRDAVYSMVMDRLSATGDLPGLIQRGEVDAARHLAREMSDDMQLILDGLGWDAGAGEGAVELPLSPAQLRRTFSRLRQLAIEERDADPWEAGDTGPDALLVIAGCDQVLAMVGEGSTGVRGNDTC